MWRPHSCGDAGLRATRVRARPHPGKPLGHHDANRLRPPRLPRLQRSVPGRHESTRGQGQRRRDRRQPCSGTTVPAPRHRARALGQAPGHERRSGEQQRMACRPEHVLTGISEPRRLPRRPAVRNPCSTVRRASGKRSPTPSGSSSTSDVEAALLDPGQPVGGPGPGVPGPGRGVEHAAGLTRGVRTRRGVMIKALRSVGRIGSDRGLPALLAIPAQHATPRRQDAPCAEPHFLCSPSPPWR